jgi:predicted HAD superfamily Cof-like phosphohydrolase
MDLDTELDDLNDFMCKFGLREETITVEWLLERASFIAEELNELKEAIANRDLVKVFDALLDIVYVAKGSAVYAGLPWDEGWIRVHESNMAKEPGGPSERLTKDLIKPPGWRPPELAKLLAWYSIAPTL